MQEFGIIMAPGKDPSESSRTIKKWDISGEKRVANGWQALTRGRDPRFSVWL
jgi:hypothetical protein